MGQLFSALLSTNQEGINLVMNFEDPKPTEQEAKAYGYTVEFLERAQGALRLLEDYKGCQDITRKAMSTPTQENEAAAFEALLVVTNQIHTFFDTARDLEKVLSMLVQVLSTPAHSPNVETKQEKTETSIPQHHALAKKLGEVLDFSLRFDQTRMMRPYISNDFSYYRRLLPKFNKHPDIRVKDDEASGIALFTAEYIPMMKALCKSAGHAAQTNPHVGGVLAVFANSCYGMLKSNRYEKVDTNLFIARAMTGACVLFDHVDVLGVFHKKAPIKIKDVIVYLKKEFPKEQALLNSIQFSTKNFKEAPDTITELFE
jgi:hypothetical protein